MVWIHAKVIHRTLLEQLESVQETRRETRRLWRVEWSGRLSHCPSLGETGWRRTRTAAMEGFDRRADEDWSPDHLSQSSSPPSQYYRLSCSEKLVLVVMHQAISMRSISYCDVYSSVLHVRILHILPWSLIPGRELAILLLGNGN